MRFDGTLIKWNAERGFGFIAPSQGGHELFVHITAFRRGGRQPTVGDALSFEVQQGADGKKRAVQVLGAGQTCRSPLQAGRPAARTRPAVGREWGLSASVLSIAVVLALGWWGYGKYSDRLRANSGTGQDTPVALLIPTVPLAQTAFRCDGRTHCSQMTSCQEATYFLKNCPDVKMDGNHDGVPCEQQWCIGGGSGN